MSKLSLILDIFRFSVIISEIRGQCCRKNLITNLCRDGAEGTPCCGVTACNIFCCNCSNGDCRQGDHTVWRHLWNKLVAHVRGNRSPRDVHVHGMQLLDLEEHEHEHDKNKDGFYDVDEAHKLLLSGTCGNYKEKVKKFASEFQRMDKDKDGKLSYEEING